MSDFNRDTPIAHIASLVGGEPGKAFSIEGGTARGALKYLLVITHLWESSYIKTAPMATLRLEYNSAKMVDWFAIHGRQTLGELWAETPYKGPRKRRTKAEMESSRNGRYQIPETTQVETYTPPETQTHYVPETTHNRDSETQDSPEHTMADMSEAEQLQRLLLKILGERKTAIDPEQIRAIIREEMAGVIYPTRVTLETPEIPETKDMGIQHFCFPDLLRAVSARLPNGNRLNVWLSGPAGSGKTTAAENVAEALGLKYYFTGAIDTEYKLLGYTDANGNLVSRQFRQAYEHGGVYLIDEIDRCLPGALLAINAALANGYCDFPDGIVKRHPDCVIIAAANTWGLGGTSDYVGAMKHDAALLDRFPAKIAWPIDEGLESAISPNLDWTRYVQQTRAKAAEKGLKVIISPRASLGGSALLAAGMPWERVKEVVLKQGMSSEQWASIAA